MVVALADVDVPHVRMCVEENEAERPVHRRVRAQLAEHDEMVAAQAEGSGTGPDDRLEMLCYLGDRSLGVAGRHRHVAEIGDGEVTEDLRFLRRVVRAQSDRGGADRLGPETGARAIRRRGVERDAENRDVDVLGALDERAAREGLHARVPRSQKRVGRPVAGNVLSRHRATVPAAVSRWRQPRSTPRPDQSVADMYQGLTLGHVLWTDWR